MAGVPGKRDLVHVHIMDSVPIQMRALPYADRVEIRFGKAFPVALVIDRPALVRLGEAIRAGEDELAASASGEA